MNNNLVTTLISLQPNQNLVDSTYTRTYEVANAFLDHLEGKRVNKPPIMLTVGLHLHTSIQLAQAHVLTLDGVVNKLEQGTEEDLTEFEEFIGVILTKPYDVEQVKKCRKMHHIHLLDLIELREKVQSRLKVFQDKNGERERMLKDGWSNPLTGCRSTWHEKITDIMPIIEREITVGVESVAVELTYWRDGKRIDYETKDADTDRVMEVLLGMSQTNHVGRCYMEIRHDDPIYDRVLEIKNADHGLVNFTVDRDVFNASKRSIDNLVESLRGFKDINHVNHDQLSLMRTYIYAHIKLLAHLPWLAKTSDDMRTVVMPLYYRLSRAVRLKHFETGCGLKDPLSVIQLIHRHFGYIQRDKVLTFKVKK